MRDRPIQLAMIGCGAITEHIHLPAAAGIEGLRVSLLVDQNRRRAEWLAEEHAIPHVADDYRRLPLMPDAVLIALPHALHGPVSLMFLQQGVHVLVEKPMALSSADCHAMLRAATAAGVQLAVGLVRRFLTSTVLAKIVLESQILGPIQRFDVREGQVYAWPTTSDAMFRRQNAGGGVLMDTGAHVLDTLLFWLGEAATVEYRDDQYGGVEAEAELHLTMHSGAVGTVELSRTRQLRNTALLYGTEATLAVDLIAGGVQLHRDGTSVTLQGKPNALGWPTTEGGLDLFRVQLVDWVAAIRRGRPPAVPGAEGCRSVALIERCYAQRKPLLLPWLREERGR
jgi:predicted dehydrogenase